MLSWVKVDPGAVSLIKQPRNETTIWDVRSVVMNGDYMKIASCAYPRLDKTAGNGIKKVDLDGSSRLALESGGVRHWELLFRPAGKNETKVDLSVVQTRWVPTL
jgi:hypothetical protein